MAGAGVLSAMRTYLDFEKPIAEFESKIAELTALYKDEKSDSISHEIATLEEKAQRTLEQLYAKLTPWQKTQVARHPDRPHFSDYVSELVEDFTPLAGDRYFAEDSAIVGGIGRFRDRPVLVIGHEKGSDTEARIKHNFGMARPEGYRKAVRLMRLADRFSLPIITFIDTAGAYPGIGAEERGQAEAIARSTDCCLSLGVPMIAVIIGEGGSGGAVAIATANRIFMLEHAIYTVASPEAAASILWHDSSRAKDAATSMKITSQDLMNLKVIDSIIGEPIGGAHRSKQRTISRTGVHIQRALRDFDGLSRKEIRRQRQDKFLAIGRSL